MEHDKKKKAAGDGLHHHEIHEDEGGGFHSKHTHPDGTEEHGDHATYEEATADQDAKFGKSPEEEEAEEGESFPSGAGDDDDMAESYERSARG